MSLRSKHVDRVKIPVYSFFTTTKETGEKLGMNDSFTRL